VKSLYGCQKQNILYLRKVHQDFRKLSQEPATQARITPKMTPAMPRMKIHEGGLNGLQLSEKPGIKMKSGDLVNPDSVVVRVVRIDQVFPAVTLKCRSKANAVASFILCITAKLVQSVKLKS